MNLATLTEFLTGSARRVHLIGVAGSGMSGIAGLLLALGHRVSGSDKVVSIEVGRLEKKGLHFHVPHEAEEVHGADLIVYSSAIKAGNVAYEKGHRGLWHAREDDHVVHGGSCSSKLRTQTFALCGR